MLQLYQLVTSCGTLAFCFTLLWTLHMDIRLIRTASGNIKQRTDLPLLSNTQRVRDLLSDTEPVNGVPSNCQDGQNVLERASKGVANSNDTRMDRTEENTVKPNADGGKAQNYWNAFKRSLEERKVLHHHGYEYVLRPRDGVCAGDAVFLLVYVHSAPENHKRRMIIRNTWGSPYNIPLLRLKVQFSSPVPHPSTETQGTVLLTRTTSL